LPRTYDLCRVRREIIQKKESPALTIGVAELSRPKSEVLWPRGHGILDVASEGSHSRRILHLFNLWRLDLEPAGRRFLCGPRRPPAVRVAFSLPSPFDAIVHPENAGAA